MISNTERLIAKRFLKPRNNDGFLSVIAGFSLVGIALGVATLIVVMSVMNGFRAELMKQIFGLNGHIGIYSIEGTLADYGELLPTIQKVPHVMSVIPQIERQAMILRGEKATGVMVRGVNLESLKAHPKVFASLEDKNTQPFSDGDGIIIGDKMAESFNLRIGDALTLVAPNFTQTGFGTLPRLKEYRIINIFSVGMYEYDAHFIFMPQPLAEVFFRVPKGSVDSLSVQLDDVDAVNATAKMLNETLTRAVMLRDWRQANSSFFSAVEVERNVMFIILSLIIMVAAFNIISSLVMLVKNKTMDIAILQTLGLPPRSILRIFVLCGMRIGVVGTVSGFVLGLLVTENLENIRGFLEKIFQQRLFPSDVYFLTKLPTALDWGQVGWVVSMSLVLSLLATLYPSLKASKINPVEALRYV